MVNEVDYDNPGGDDREFVELYNAGESAVDLAAGGYDLILVNHTGDIYRRFDLTGTIEAKGYYVIGSASAANVDQVVTPSTNLIQNGDSDAVALATNDGQGGPDTLVDGLAYEGPNPVVNAEGYTSQFDSNSVDGSLVRFPNGVDTGDNSADFRFDSDSNPSPGEANSPTYVPPEQPTIYFIDVGEGDSTLIVSPSGKTMLIDGGDNGEGVAAVIPLLKSLGIDGQVKSLDVMLATHYDADHIGGLDEVASEIPPATAYDRGGEKDTITTTFSNYVAAIGSVRQQIQLGQIIDLGAGLTVQVLCAGENLSTAGERYENLIYPGAWPVWVGASQENELAIGLKISYGSFHMSVAGDLSGGGLGSDDVESDLATAMGKLSVYQVNHHASLTSSTTDFLQVIQPEVAVISVGPNSFGHPVQTIVDRIRSIGGATVYQTELGSAGQGDFVAGGTIILRTDGDVFTLEGGDLTPTQYVAGPARVEIQPGQVVINELRINDEGGDDAEFVELFGPGGLSLEGCSLWAIEGYTGAEDKLTSLDGQVIPPDGYFVVGNASVANLDLLDPGEIPWENGPDAIELRQGVQVLDRVGYGSGGVGTYYEGSGPAPADPDDDDSIGRDSSATDSDDNARDFIVQAASPGEANRAQGNFAGLLLTEVSIRNNAEEFVEIVNLSDDTMLIEGVLVSDENTATSEGSIRFPSGATIAPNEVIVVLLGATSSESPSTEFQAALKPGTQVFSQQDGVTLPGFTVTAMEASGGTIQLSNSGDNVALYQPAATVGNDSEKDLCLDGMNYGGVLTGPVGPNLDEVQSASTHTAGDSLQRTSSTDHNDSSQDFTAAAFTPGSVSFGQVPQLGVWIVH